MKIQKQRPLLSICIPTYNRTLYLQECLKSIVSQLSLQYIIENVEIVISDNHSTDNTKQVVESFMQKNTQIRYFCNEKNLGPVVNVKKVAEYALGDYVWFFSDDDIHKKGSIAKILSIIKLYIPDVIQTNMDLCSIDAKKIIDPNLLRVQKDTFLETKKAYFTFLEDKFFLPLDWYLTSFSNTIILRKLFQKNIKFFDQFNKSEHIFPHIAIIFYTNENYKICIVAQSVALFRTGNREFGPKSKVEFLKFWYRVLNIHYQTILSVNHEYISIKFRFLYLLKYCSRIFRIIFLRLFQVDISDFLIKLFYR
ncbi:hypothetical protein CO051_04270 [Candidatus Roizmanbacteria bacterium CG_4_9_14_0_2_um_filter_39_13]|uniref:Glycosyltransferase 2-like domain-containing protein n=1 Tax=Candidatus Roizmanbacteria bacterium CG_4_9_14_0_2_um_filter_39_13 TaxID=1974839 RepID=A0A2M8EY79_9BACT|nr:MAG: hypothetical protein CO051_04270 [Candidatus Roizmanbacteria bacterium CG_4_9_14_0_2_um_filter_39_13]